MPEELNQAVATLVREAIAAEIGTPYSITVDLQASGEHPYRVMVLEEQYPQPGLARTEPLSPSDPEA